MMLKTLTLSRVRAAWAAFWNPPISIQAECLSQPWYGVTHEWLMPVMQRFQHQEQRAAAIQMLEEKAGKLRGESGAVLLADGLGNSKELRSIGPSNDPISLAACDHARRVAEHVQYCCDCDTILARNSLVMIRPDELEGLRNACAELNKVALWMRVNKAAEIERGAHAGRSDSEVIIGYLSGNR